MRGSLPSSFGTLTADLVYLELANNRLSGVVPDSVFSSGSLREATLSNNFFSGGFPGCPDSPDYSLMQVYLQVSKRVGVTTA